MLSVGQVGCYGLSFIRNLILARLLTKADFGLAAALSMAVSLLELVTRMGFRNLIVQSRSGDDPSFQAVTHSIQAAIGVLSCVLVAVGAYPMALAFSVPELTWAFALLAIVPLIRGLMHLDVSRVQRHFAYGPGVLTELLPQVLATATAWPLAWWLRDFRAVLWIMLGKEVLTFVMSHLLAERPYRWAWDPDFARQALAFGWPLLLNGVVMFAAQQGDQMIIGASFSLEDLGTYSIAFTLTAMTWYIFGNVGTSLMLPALARHHDNPALFKKNYCRCLDLSTLLAMVILAPMIVSGDVFVRLLYGPKYSGVGTLMCLFGAIMALRFFRWAPAVAAMSRADTINQFIGNIARASSLPLALLVLALGAHSVAAVAACGLSGEVLAISVSVLRVRKYQEIALAAYRRPLIFLVVWVGIAVAVHHSLGNGISVWMGGAAVFVLWGIGTLASLFLLPDLASLYRQVIANYRIPILSGRD